MNTPVSVRDPSSSRAPGSVGWTRGRIIFLSISGVCAVAILLWAREVMLPFILAVIVAYVLTPLVARVERLRVPRAAAILLVYFATLGSIYIGFATTFPRIYVEGVKFAREAPALMEQLSTEWAPQAEGWLHGMLQRVGHRQAPAQLPPPEPPPALEVRQEPDGSYSIQIGAGIDVVQRSPGYWRIGPAAQRGSSRLNIGELTAKGIEEFVSYVKHNAFELLRIGHAVVASVSKAIFLLFMTLMAAGYIMMTREDILGFFRSLVPARARLSFDRLTWRIDRGLSGVVRGQLLICAVNGVLSMIGFWMFDLKYWPILTIIAAVMSIVPIFGSILSSIPAVLIGLTQSFWTGLWVLLWILGVHQVEANLLNPKIIGVAAKIHPVLVVMALLIGEHFFGLWGALLGVPVLSLAQSIFNHFRFESLPDAPPDSLLPPTGRGHV